MKGEDEPVTLDEFVVRSLRGRSAHALQEKEVGSKRQRSRR